MPWSGGSFTRTNGVHTGATLWVQDRDAGTKILATRHDTHDQDLADGINSTLEKSGSNAATGNLDIGSNRLTAVADGTAKTDAATVNQIQSNGPAYQATDTGTANAHVIALSPAITAYASGQKVTFKSGAASTTASTLNVNGLGVKAIKKLHDQDIASGDIESGSIVTVVYDGTNFQMTSQLASEAASGFTLSATDVLDFGASTLTLSSGAVTGTGSRHVIAAQSGTTDDFDTLATTNYSAGSLVFITADAGDIIHITNAGNFSETWVLSETEPATFMLIGSTWYQLDRKINANLAENGGFRVAQRGATITSPTGTTVTLDRWKYSDQSGTGRVTITQSTTVPNNDFANSLKVDVTTADSSIAAGDLYRIHQYGLGLSCGHIAAGAAGAKDITISFWWRSDSSALSYPAIFCGTFGNGSENRVYPFEFSQTTNATWQFHVVTIPGDTTGTWVRTNAKNCYMAINLAVGSDWHGTNKTWSANYDYSTSNQVNGMGHTGNDFYLAGYKAEIGPIATPFDHRPYAEELSICQAYFWKWFDDGAGSTFGIGGFENATRFVIQLDFPQTMRAEPTVTVSNPTSFKANTQSENNLAMDSLNGNDTSRFGVGLQFACTAGTADEVGRWGVSSTNAAVLLDAEL
jgi:hypothetical protein